MHPARAISVFASLLAVCALSYAQKPGPEFWRKVSCEPLEPRTKLESLEDRYTTIILKGFTRITTLEVRGVRVDAIEMREFGSNARVKGVVIVLRETGGRLEDNRAFIDYDELDPLLNAIDTLSRLDETSTKLAGFEGRYRTKGDFEIQLFRQTRSGNAVVLQTGICELATQSLSLDELAKVKALFQEAKARLDEIK
ncbi:MAG TPA: hypothetical protein VLE19_17575 [Pyrinomonadaceae bacterium]|nr:hypothetical protein [Pyrinomonadaceae bacterium]